jgi:hypothetical protein
MITFPIRRGWLRRTPPAFSPTRWGVWLLLSLLVVWLPLGAAGDNDKRAFGKYVLAGVETIPVDYGCIDFVSWMSAKSFFEGMEWINSPQGVVFSKDGKPVTEFPETLTLTMRPYFFWCSSPEPLDSTPLSPVPLNLGSMKASQFDLFWKRGEEMRPVVGYTVKIIPPSSFRESGTEQSMYEFKLPGKDVPLTDALVVVFKSRDKKPLFRIAARVDYIVLLKQKIIISNSQTNIPQK